MSCASFPMAKAVSGWCGHWPSRRMRTGSSSIATSTWMICANTKRKHCDVGLSPDLFSLAPCSPPSRPLRAASGGGLRPVLTAAARGALPEGRSGRRDGSVRSNKGMLALIWAQASPPPMTDLLNFAHTTREYRWGAAAADYGEGLTHGYDGHRARG